MFCCIDCAHGGERAIDADHRIATRGQFAGIAFQMADRLVKIDVGASVIEMHSHIRIALCRFDHRRVKRGSPDRVDAFFWIDIVQARNAGRPDLS